MGCKAKKIRRIVMLAAANLLSGTHFFATKRLFLNAAGIPVGIGTRIVGPVHIGTVASLSIGEDTWVGRNLCIEGNGTVQIGNRVDIAPHVVFSTGGHEIGGASRRAGAGRTFTQNVGEGCWIGIRSTFVNDVVLGNGSVVAAGAVVTKDVPAGTLIGGVPARTIKTLDVSHG